MKLIDLTGQRFGRLVVTRRAEDKVRPNGAKVPYWYCDCDCGTKDKEIAGSDLKRGNSKSCGCLQKELARERRRLDNKNTYDLTGDYGIGYTNKGDIFYFDLEDYDKIKEYCWRKRRDEYLDAKLLDGSRKRILLHNLVMGEKYIDHINHERNDVRKKNLRKRLEEHSFDTCNQMNKCIQSNNTSGVTGVAYHKRNNVWEAYISIDNKRIHLGDFVDFEKAVKARRKAEEKYFGEWSYRNSMDYSA